MKKIALLCCAFIFGMSTLLHSQTQSNLNELLLRLSENHMGAVSDVFTLEEQQILRNYFDVINPNTDVSEGPVGIDFYGPNNTSRTFNRWSLDMPNLFVNLGPSIIMDPDFEGAGGWDYNEQHFSGISLNNEFYEVSVSGNYSSLGTISPPLGESWIGGEYSPVNNDYYALSTDGMTNTSTLSLIDKGTATATPIGNTGIMLPINLSIDMMGFGYSVDLDGDVLYRINLTTAVAMPIGPIGFDCNFGQGLAFDKNSGLTYFSAFNNDSFQSELRSIDTDTGLTLFLGPLGSMSPGGTVQVAWLGIPDNQLAINDFVTNVSLSFPNPVTNELQLSASHPIDMLEIYNLLGQKLSVDLQLDVDAVIDVSNLETGTYLIRATINRKLRAYKFIKK